MKRMQASRMIKILDFGIYRNYVFDASGIPAGFLLRFYILLPPGVRRDWIPTWYFFASHEKESYFLNAVGSIPAYTGIGNQPKTNIQKCRRYYTFYNLFWQNIPATYHNYVFTFSWIPTAYGLYTFVAFVCLDRTSQISRCLVSLCTSQ